MSRRDLVVILKRGANADRHRFLPAAHMVGPRPARLLPRISQHIQSYPLGALSADPTQQRGADRVSGSVRVVAVELAIDPPVGDQIGTVRDRDRLHDTLFGH